MGGVPKVATAHENIGTDPRSDVRAVEQTSDADATLHKCSRIASLRHCNAVLSLYMV